MCMQCKQDVFHIVAECPNTRENVKSMLEDGNELDFLTDPSHIFFPPKNKLSGTERDAHFSKLADILWMSQPHMMSDEVLSGDDDECESLCDASCEDEHEALGRSELRCC